MGGASRFFRALADYWLPTLIGGLQVAYVASVVCATGALVWIFQENIAGMLFAVLLFVAALHPELFHVFGFVMSRIFNRIEYPYEESELFTLNRGARLLLNQRPTFTADTDAWCKNNLSYWYGVTGNTNHIYSEKRPITVWFVSRSDSLLFKLRWS